VLKKTNEKKKEQLVLTDGFPKQKILSIFFLFSIVHNDRRDNR
jgi:hypothetical protein